MLIQRGYKTEMDPNKAQTEMLRRHTGAARFAYNWALAKKDEIYRESGKSLNAFSLNKELTKLKQTECPWLKEERINVSVLQSAFRNLCRAYDNWFRAMKKGDRRVKHPKFHSRFNSKQSFTMYGSLHVEESRVKLPNIGWIKLKERGYLPTNDVRMLAMHVSSSAGRWYVTAQVEEEIEVLPASGPPMGVDLGINPLAVCSDGTVFQNPKALDSAQRKLARLQRQHARKQKGSSSRAKHTKKIARLHARVSNIRAHATHNATTYIARDANPTVLGIEDLNVLGMLSNSRLARAVADANMHEFKRQLSYKAEWNGIRVVKADRWYPSSKTCSSCGSVKGDLSRSDRVYMCAKCGMVLDRDLNAAVNLRNLAAKPTESINACGGESSGPEDRTKLAPVKQEPTSEGEMGDLP